MKKIIISFLLVILHLVCISLKIAMEKIQINKAGQIEIFMRSKELNVFTDSRSGNFSNMLLFEKHNWLFFTGNDFVYRLNSLNISDLFSLRERHTPATTSNNKDILDLTASKQSKANTLRLLLHRKSHSDLIVCGTNLGKSHIYDLKQADLSFQIEYNGRYLCPSNDNHSNLGLITKALGTNLMFSALWTDDTKYGIFRKDVEYNGHFLRTLDSTKWLWEPDFVALVDYKQFVFVFFTEKRDAISSRRVSKVARLCKNDQGVFFEDKSKFVKLF